MRAFQWQRCYFKGRNGKKIKAALDTRIDENLAIIARTDALAVNGMEDAMDRAYAYAEAGQTLFLLKRRRRLTN